jgi:hypothetical protein
LQGEKDIVGHSQEIPRAEKQIPPVIITMAIIIVNSPKKLIAFPILAKATYGLARLIHYFIHFFSIFPAYCAAVKKIFANFAPQKY